MAVKSVVVALAVGGALAELAASEALVRAVDDRVGESARPGLGGDGDLAGWVVSQRLGDGRGGAQSEATTNAAIRRRNRVSSLRWAGLEQP